MSFDLIGRFKQALPGWRTRMQTFAINSTYAMITACALWPVAEAAKAGDLSGAAELARLLGGGVGVNLIANHLQNWKDEADCARKLEALPLDDALRKQLDELLQRLDGLAAAQDALPATDKQWFQETLRRELTQLGNVSKFESDLKAVQSGGGAIAQGCGNVAAGDRGLAVGGDFHGNVTIN